MWTFEEIKRTRCIASEEVQVEVGWAGDAIVGRENTLAGARLR